MVTSIKHINANGLFVYVGDVISFVLSAPCNDAAAAACDLNAVNFTTGNVTTQATVYFAGVIQTKITVTITAIDSSSGAITYTTTQS